MRKKWIVIGTLILLGMFVTLRITVLAAEANEIQVSFIDVGQGDSILIQDSNGFDVLIDGGKTSAGPTVVAYIRINISTLRGKSDRIVRNVVPGHTVCVINVT